MFVFDMCIYIYNYEHIPLNSQYNIPDVRLISKNTYICIYTFYTCILLLHIIGIDEVIKDNSENSIDVVGKIIKHEVRVSSFEPVISE